MDLINNIKKFGLVKIAIDAGGSIHPLIIPPNLTKGTAIMNPSIFLDGDQLIVNIRHVNYALYHSEIKKFQHRYGPLQYIHPENDMTLRTWNFFAILDKELNVTDVASVDTSLLDVDPKWEFVGLEDARLVKWDGKLYMCGVRRDTTTNGQGRMELSELGFKGQHVQEISRHRIPAPLANDSYCEKNWMPIIDKPYHFVKWSNPTEVVKYDINSGATTQVHLDESKIIPGLPDFRGSSQVIPYGDYYFAVLHGVNLTKSKLGEKDGDYHHRFVLWDKKWNIIKYTDIFSFMKADIEFSCGACFVDDNLLISFSFQDNAAFILNMPKTLLNEMLEI
jgi:hypothetical protein